MSYYELTNLAKRNLYEYIKNVFIVAGKSIQILDAFPTDENFNRPALSIEYDDFFDISPSDMGATDEIVSYSYSLDFFAKKDNFERENIVSILLDNLKNKSIMILDYNEATPTLFGYMNIISADAVPIRVDTPTKEETKRAKITLTVEIYRKIL